MNNNTTEKYIKEMLDKNLFAVIYPKDKSEKSAEELVDVIESVIESAVGIAKFQDEEGTAAWGVLIDKRKIKESFKLTEEKNESDSL